MKILITGITGQVGSILADYVLQHTKLDVVGLMRWQEPTDNIRHLIPLINEKHRIQLVNGDLTDFTSLFRIICEHKPDYVSHLAAQSFPKTSFDSPVETLQTNIIGTCNLLEAIRLNRQEHFDPVVHICSSSEVYGRAPVGVKLDEETKFHAASPYSLSKIGTDYLGQFYAEAYNMNTFVTRMGTHSGRRRSDVFFESTVAKQIALIERGLQQPQLKLGNLDSVRTFQDARDAVDAYYKLLKAARAGELHKGECFNIAGEEVFKLTEIVDIMLSMSTRKDISVQLDHERLRPIDADYQMFDNTKIRSKIDWKPKISVKEMLHDLLEFWRTEIDNGRVPLSR